MHRAGETIADGRRRVAAPYGNVIHNWPYAAYAARSKKEDRGQAMLRAAGARRLTRTLSQCPTGAKKIAR